MAKRTRTRSPSPTTGDVKNFFTPKRARAFATTGHTRAPSPEAGGADGLMENKPGTSEAQVVHRKIASPEAAAAVDAHPPFFQLRDAAKLVPIPQEPGQAVVYWQRMQDMRACDNRALAQASQHAQQLNLPLVVLFVISPDEYAAHDRSARRIDFALRNLAELRHTYAELHIPLHIITHSSRKTLPQAVMQFLRSIDCRYLYSNIEYEVDELRRDIEICKLSQEQAVKPTFTHDKCIIEPATLFTGQGKPYTVYSPFQRKWLDKLNTNLHLLDEAPLPAANSVTIHDNAALQCLFESEIPDHIEGFECSDKDVMETLWPEGTSKAREILSRFVYTQSRASQLGLVDPLNPGAEPSDKHSRLMAYADGRDRADRDTSSRLSPYLASGVISIRECVREVMKANGRKKGVDGGRETGPGRWVQELAWRDFYVHILAAFPRVSMGRPFLEKFNDVKWEVQDDHLKAWEQGRTGFPIVDAAMRQCNQMGWMHNRLRMIAAMVMCKTLMLDWRLGERYFMQSFIDGDLASNNGGWQWVASTGCDAQPYFRIMNPYNQSLKADPTGDFIRTFVPELASLRGNEIHNPPAAVAKKLGYPLPLVDHAEARKRALARYKNPGQE